MNEKENDEIEHKAFGEQREQILYKKGKTKETNMQRCL